MHPTPFAFASELHVNDVLRVRFRFDEPSPVKEGEEAARRSRGGEGRHDSGDDPELQCGRLESACSGERVHDHDHQSDEGQDGGREELSHHVLLGREGSFEQPTIIFFNYTPKHYFCQVCKISPRIRL